GSLNMIIGEIINENNNKQTKGITGYLTNSLYNREDVVKDAVISRFISFFYKEERNLLDQQINQYKLKNK
ncbi:MAG: DUF84 family protein, partial [Firmicutes bacterium]|nr:DUF84 family protein [Bacillota bacterium]